MMARFAVASLILWCKPFV